MSVSVAGVGGTIVRLALRFPPGIATVTFPVVVAATARTLTVRLPLDAPPGMNTLGTVSLSRSLSSENVAVRPAAGTGPSSVNEPVAVFGLDAMPPARVDGLNVRVATAGAFTARFNVLLMVPRVAVMVALEFAVSGTAVTLNVAVD